MFFGAHVSAAGGVSKAPGNASTLGCECFQFFSQSPRGGARKLPLPEEVLAFREATVRLGLRPGYIHAPYFINLASKDNRIYHGSVEALKKELTIADMLGARGVITHLGSAKDYPVGERIGESEAGVQMGPLLQLRATSAAGRIIKALGEIEKARTGEARLILENAAGAGRILGSSLEELAFLLKEAPGVGGICLDTAHAFASGLELRGKEAINELIKLIKKTVGLKRLWAIHANDSLVDFDSHKDRHAHLGEGKIGQEAFREMVLRPELKGVDFMVETPTPEGMARDIEMLKGFRDGE